MCLLQALFILNTWIAIISGQQFCHDSEDCSVRMGFTCQNSQCIRQGPAISQPQPLTPGDKHGSKCYTDTDCDHELICDKVTKFCKCRRGKVWDVNSQRCSLQDEEPAYPNKKQTDLFRDLFILSAIMGVLAVILAVCYNILCSRTSWRRRRRGNDLARALEEVQIPYAGTSQPTWIASYRGSIPSIGPFISVFGTVERSGPPCLLLPVGPPTYEEALKHKVILSSNHPPSITVIETTPL